MCVYMCVGGFFVVYYITLWRLFIPLAGSQRTRSLYAPSKSTNSHISFALNRRIKATEAQMGQSGVCPKYRGTCNASESLSRWLLLIVMRPVKRSVRK